MAFAALPTLKPSVPSKMLTCRLSNVGVEHGNVHLGRTVQQGDLGARLKGQGLLVLKLEGARSHVELTHDVTPGRGIQRASAGGLPESGSLLERTSKPPPLKPVFTEPYTRTSSVRSKSVTSSKAVLSFGADATQLVEGHLEDGGKQYGTGGQPVEVVGVVEVERVPFQVAFPQDADGFLLDVAVAHAGTGAPAVREVVADLAEHRAGVGVLLEIPERRGVAEEVEGAFRIARGRVADQPHHAAVDRQEDLVAEVEFVAW